MIIMFNKVPSDIQDNRDTREFLDTIELFLDEMCIGVTEFRVNFLLQHEGDGNFSLFAPSSWQTGDRGTADNSPEHGERAWTGTWAGGIPNNRNEQNNTKVDSSGTPGSLLTFQRDTNRNWKRTKIKR